MGDMADDLEQKCMDASERYEELMAMNDGDLFEEFHRERRGLGLSTVIWSMPLTKLQRQEIIIYLTEENKF
jgi:hypothetical protein